MVSTRTLLNAVIGAVVGVVLSFIPFSTVLGGLVAGFLEGPDSRQGATVGAIAGAITFLPIAGMGLVVFGILGLGLTGGVPLEGFALVSIVIAVGGLFALFYTVGLSLLGGYLGAYLAREYPDRHHRTRATIGYETESGRAPPADGEPTWDRDSGTADSREFGADRTADERDADRERDRDRF
ncbi:hypothetical protein C488_18700 [Natrinema pellirubrum DSM 15624]|nr:DUF5518 domain-containing protein [Natrinema pellirubrum]ELY70472.1 hypothetical protein C488_18700 [Natrinema pellirubrum DSM 15624]